MSDRTGQSLGSLAGYGMSESDGEEDYTTKLSGNISGSDDENSSHSQAASRTYSPVTKDDEPPRKKTAQVSSLGLVSYGGHEDDSDQEAQRSDVEQSPNAPISDGTVKDEQNADTNQNSAADEQQLSGPEVENGNTETTIENQADSESDDDIVIPPSPPGKCSRSLVEKINKMHQQVKYGRFDLDAKIQSSKEFRNPSIYEKLLSHVGIDEKGTNYPPELFDPSIWDKSSFYDELAKAQNIEMEKRKNEKKDRVKVDFISGTKTDGEAPVQRKSKWDSGGAVPAASILPVGALIKRK